MDLDHQDLLAIWFGDLDPGEERRSALFARLRADEAFRTAFVEDIRLLGMLTAVQSAEPRWLLLEDASGWSARQREDVETLAQQVVRKGRRRPTARTWLRRLIIGGVAAAGLAAACLYVVFLFSPKLEPRPDSPTAPWVEVATAIQVNGVHWDMDDSELPPREGDVVRVGRLRFHEGRVTLVFFSGVTLTVEGPADLDLLAGDRVFCRRGRLRARVPHGAEGFTVVADGCEVVDLGTEFGLNIERGGHARVMVFAGEAAVSILGKDGRSIQGALLESDQAVVIDQNAGLIQQVPPQAAAFIALGEFASPPLDLAASYGDVVLAAKPWGYWRFDSLAGRQVQNEIAGRPVLKVLGSLELEQSPGKNHYVHFRLDDHAQGLLLDGEWAPSQMDGFAIELWMQADLPSPNSYYNQTALLSLIAKDNDKAESHLIYMELATRGRRSPHEPCAVRLLNRPSPTLTGEAAISRKSLVASRWHHIVGQKSAGTLELYIDGECVGTSPARQAGKDAANADPTPCQLLLGRLKLHSGTHIADSRPFEGRIDELALYDHPLSPEEIRRHAHLRAGSVAP